MTDRREFLKLSMGLIGAETLSGCCSGGRACHRSCFRGIQVGTITYSFRTMPRGERDAIEMVRYCRDSGVGTIELMARTVEGYLGAPVVRRDDPDDLKRLTAWRENFRDWGKVRDLRDRFADAGVGIHIVKFGEIGKPFTSDGENDYFCRMARTMGAKAITREVPEPETWGVTGRRLGKIADRNDMCIGFHNHMQITKDTYEGALLGYSPRLAINFDIGHYVASNDDDPLKVISRFHDRIVSVHLKDRTTKAHGQKELPFGEGDTPLGPLFAQMRSDGHDFNVDIELEYEIPRGSDAVKEVARCVEYSMKTIG